MYKTAIGLNANATSILFIMSVMRFSCLHVHNICAKLFVSSMNIALVKCLQKMHFFTTTTYLQMVNSHWYQQTHTSNIQGSKYSILDVHSPLSKHNVGCSNGSEISALTEAVTLEIDVCTTNARNMTECFNALNHCSRLQRTIFQSWRFLGWTCTMQ